MSQYIKTFPWYNNSTGEYGTDLIEAYLIEKPQQRIAHIGVYNATILVVFETK